MAGQRGANRNIGGLAIADFAHHDDVGGLPDDVAQTRRKRQPDLRIHVNLVDPVHLIFDRVLDGDDLLVGLVDALERGV